MFTAKCSEYINKNKVSSGPETKWCVLEANKSLACMEKHNVPINNGDFNFVRHRSGGVCAREVRVSGVLISNLPGATPESGPARQL